MEWAWLIPVFSFAAVPLIILFGRHLPGRGSPLAIAAIAGGFALFWIVLFSFLNADPAGALIVGFDAAVKRAREIALVQE